MINELLWLVLLLATFACIMLAYKFFGKTGLYVWMGVAIILANMQVLKTIGIFGFVTALGNIIYGTTFLVTDILNEKYGQKAARKAVWIGFFMLIATTLVMQICLLFVPHESDFSQGSLQTIFGFLPRIAFASLLAFIVSQHHDVWSFGVLKRKTKGKYLWFRNNASTLVSQLIDNVIFTAIAFTGILSWIPFLGWGQVFSWNIVIQIFVVSYLMKFIVAALDTPFVYWAKRITPKEE